MRCSWGWVILWRSIKSTAIKTFYTFTVRVAEFARLETLAVFLHAVRALASTSLLGFGWTGLALPNDHFPHKGVRVFAENMLNGLVPKFLFTRH
jgi:hypothetical protein